MICRIIKKDKTLPVYYKTEVSASSPYVSPREPQWIGHTSSRVGGWQRPGWTREMNEVKYSRWGSENSFVCRAMSEVAIRLAWERERGSGTRLRIRWQHKLTSKLCKTLQREWTGDWRESVLFVKLSDQVRIMIRHRKFLVIHCENCVWPQIFLHYF